MMPIDQHKRILLINDGYDATGADRASRELFQALPGIGWDARFWVGRGPARSAPGVHVVPWRAERWLMPLDAIWPYNNWRHFGSRWKFAHVGPEHFDLVHVHATTDRWMSISALASLSARMPLIWTLHDEWAITGGLLADLGSLVSPGDIPGLPPVWMPQSRLYHGWRTLPIRAALQRWRVCPRALVAPSHHIAEKVRCAPWFDGVPVHVVRNGLTLAEEPATTMSRAEARRHWGLATDSPVLLLIAGSLGEPVKGVRLGLRALRHLPPDLGVQVLLVGNGADAVLREAPLGLRIVTAGPARGNTALARAYRAADITLIPSLMESLSYVAMESLACATPFVSFNVGGLAEIAASGGAVAVPPYSTQAMAEALAGLLANAARRNDMGHIGRSWVKREVSMPRYLAALEHLYWQVIGA